MSKMSDFFFSEDITYCMDGECLRTECIRHRSKAPIGVPLSWANMKYQEECLLKKIKALPSNDITKTLSVGDSLYFIKTGGKNGQAYRQLFCNAEIINILEKTTQLKLLLDKADLLEEFLSSYPSLEQSVTWEY